MPSIRHLATTSLLLPTLIAAVTLNCDHIRADGVSWDLEKLGGPKTVHNVRWEAPSIVNTTFTIDICNSLPKDKNAKKGQDCPQGTRVCGKELDYQSGNDPFLSKVIPIAGTYPMGDGRKMDPKFTRLKNDASNSDEKEGVRVELHGGKYAGKPQKAIVEFLCDTSVSGNEGFEDEKGGAIDPRAYGRMQRRDDKDDGDEEPDLPDLDKGKNLKFLSYKEEGENEVLRLQWKTKFACENAKDAKDPDQEKSAGWGFFTWFIIIVFLLAASYIIFGSWLNYNRYGARGWDLIPHGDTIRDIPYIIKDWGSNVGDRLKGGDSRGGYSAV